MSQSKKWHEDRRKGVGGSDVQDVLSLPPYGCAARLFDTKRNIKPDFEPVRNPNMERGIMLESIVCDIYANQTGEKVIKSKRMVSKKHPFMIGNVDRLIIKPEGNGILEVKCPNRDNYLRLKRLGLPEGYILQLQHYLHIAQVDWAVWAIFCADMWELFIVPVEKDEDLINMIIEAEEHFWKLVENGPRPDRLEWGDKRCKSCNRKMSCWGEKWKDIDEEEDEGKDDDYELVEDEELKVAYAEYLDDKETFKEAEAMIEDSKNKLIEILGEKERVKCDIGKILYKWQPYAGVDISSLKKDHPDLVKKYQYESLNRPFRVYPKKK